MAHITAGTKNVTLPFSVRDAGITGVSGGLTKGATLTIVGKDFGVGPSINEVLYDACDGIGVRTVNDAEVGTWTGVDTSSFPGDATYESGGRDGGNCLRGMRYDPIALRSHYYKQTLDFPESRKFYMSFWYRWMPDTFWNTNSASGRNSFDGIDSSGKEAWVMHLNTSLGYAAGQVNDLVYQGHPGGSGIKGNDTPDIMPSYNLTTQWDGAHRQDWVRFTLCVTVDPDRTVDGPVYYENIYPTRVGQKIFEQHRDTPTLFDSEYPAAPTTFNHVEFFPWYRANDLTALGATLESDVDHRMDDIYFSWGDNALARVEIGDNADYKLCTDRVLAYPDSPTWWTDSEIKVKVEIGALDFNSPLHVFVFHSDNKRVMSYPLSALQGI